MVGRWQETLVKLKGQDVATALSKAIKQIVNSRIAKIKQKHKHGVYKGQTKKVALAKSLLQVDLRNK
jgi:anti-sigma28 factor (negative regulator of flagellin synthesis)